MNNNNPGGDQPAPPAYVRVQVAPLANVPVPPALPTGWVCFTIKIIKIKVYKLFSFRALGQRLSVLPSIAGKIDVFDFQ